ncbi:MAG: DUF4012 domain-containing protein [Candidatus Magasanikbacteria bacterium]|jgi:hypothetical protein
MRKRPQVRACTICNQVGHNRSRCPKQNSEPAPIATNPAPVSNPVLHFFVHHVNHSPASSPHILDLAESKQNIFANIQSVAPSAHANSAFHFHHNQTTNVAPTTLSKTPLIGRPLYQKNPTSKSIKPKREFLFFQKIFGGINNFFTALAEIPARVRSAVENFFDNLYRYFAQVFPWKKLAFAVTALAVILIAPFQANSYYRQARIAVGDISSNSTAGFMALQASTVSLMHGDISGADTTIGNAVDKFASAIDTMQNQSKILQSIVALVPIIGDAVTSRQKILLAGQEIALGNSYLIHGLSAAQNASTTLTARLSSLSANLQSAIPNYAEASKNLNAVKTDTLPASYRQPFEDFRAIFSALNNDLRNLTDLSDSLQDIFGGEGFRRYLLVFQNPAELRPTGGFIGSFAVLDIRDGAIEKFEIPPGGPYALQGQLSENVEPPTPLLLLRPRWEFQDANWFPDFPASAEKLMRFYRKSRAVTVDGVIAINANVLEKLLAVTGPMSDTARGLTLSADNAIATIQQTVESPEARATKKPKQIITDLAPQFLGSIKNIPPAKLLPLLTELQKSLTEKDIQAYFVNSDTETKIKNFGWGGNILPTNANQDYLMVINTNIQGQKSDARIKQIISHEAMIDADGSIVDTVIITRTHTGNTWEGMYGTHNVDYIRLYVPEGSELIEASGFTWPDDASFHSPAVGVTKDSDLAVAEAEVAIDNRTGTRVTNEFGKTAFGNWIITEPGQTTQVQFIYRLPFKISTANGADKKWTDFVLTGAQKSFSYQLVAERQSGCDSSIESQIIFPDDFSPDWYGGSEIKSAANGVTIANQPLVKNQIWSVVAKN